MRAGEKFDCPHCGETSVLKSRKVMEGWSAIGSELVCALCGKKIADELPDAATSSTKKKSAKLAALLGEEPVAAPRLDGGKEAGRFCRNCVDFVDHPFKTVCGRTLKQVDPMGDCPDFRRVEKK